MADYSKEEIKRIEEKWRTIWKERKVYHVQNTSEKPKYYVLDMFPYPSGAGLHVGHPLGYIASDIVSRYKRLKGFNVLHPMGFDAFGLPAEQYAIQTGQHPRITTEKNIATYIEQLGKIGFSFDWDRKVETSDPTYYKWTQWIFMQLFNSWYNKSAVVKGQNIGTGKAEPIDTLVAAFEAHGNMYVNAVCDVEVEHFTASDWQAFDEKGKENILQKYRIAYLAETMVNWCPALGTVLSNDEVKDGVSERGGYPVERKNMLQWNMRIAAYAERLLNGLDTIDWPEPLREMQRNWIGKSLGCELDFSLAGLTPALFGGEGGEARVRGYGTSKKSYWRVLKEFSKANRQNQTETESVFWENVRGNKLGYKIRRQHAIGIFIADFVCLDRRLVIEIDGEYHMNNKEYDIARTAFLKDEGFSVIRFTIHEVKNDLSRVLAQLKSTLSQRTSIKQSALPLSPGKGRGEAIRVFTTRIDTIYGVTFMVIAPEHELVEKITTTEQRSEVMAYVEVAKNRSERERMSEVKRISGVFTGAYVVNPFNQAKVPVWIADYVLAGYGTGAVMAVPSSDIRDYAFAKHFNLPIIDVLEGAASDITKDNFDPKSGTIINSDFLNGLTWHEAIERALQKVEDLGIGVRKVNYRMRDAIFGRQRYWGEPFPVYFENGIPKLVDEKDLPVTLPEIDAYRPTETGEPPLGRAKGWTYKGHPYELTTMPGWAGSSWYWFRYMDPHNDKEFCNKEIQSYWKDVDLYIGGSEHATGHLLYSRFWCKVLKDLGYVDCEEPFEKLINQGHIQGVSKFVYRVGLTFSISPERENISNPEVFISKSYVDKVNKKTLTEEELNAIKSLFETELHSFNLIHKTDFHVPFFRLSTIQELNVDISIVDNEELNVAAFRSWRSEYKNAIVIAEKDGKYICGSEIEKMSKSKYNVVNPDDIINNYGADTLRMYEMFLGPLELSKPWNTHGIDGVFKFLRRFWNLIHDHQGNIRVSDAEPTREELKVLHKTLKKIEYDIDHFSFNTSVSEFMICSNELSSMKCNKRSIFEPLVIALSPFAPHIAEELWEKLGHSDTILNETFPVYNEEYLKENSFEYPISINGKVRAKMNFALDMPKEDIEKRVLASEAVTKWTEGKAPKKVIVVPGRIVNLVM
jgi:leucyl-tRNA synthetase